MHLSFTLPVALMAFGPAIWYIWNQQRGGVGTLSASLVLRGIGVSFLGLLALLCIALGLDVLRLLSQ